MIFIYLFIKYHIFWYILSINVDFIESSLYTTKFYSIYGQKKIMDVYYDVGVKTINKFNPIPYSTLKNSYFVVYRRGLGNI